MLAKSKIWLYSKRKEIIILGLLVSSFSVSVGLRYKHFGHALSRHHEWLSAHTMCILKIWDERGIANCHFAPVYTFSHPDDKMDYTVCALLDDHGDSYYVSYGPFSSILPYVVFNLFFLPVNMNSLIAFNLVIHFFTALFLYLLVLRLERKSLASFSIGALSVFMLYIFSPGTLWFHGNVYFSEILVQFFIAAGLYVFCRVVQNKGTMRKENIWLGVLCFFAIYTEWLGLFFTFFAGLYFFVSMLKNRVYIKPFFATLSGGILATGLIVFQYAGIAGYDKLMDAWTTKFIDRNGGSLMNKVTEEQFSVHSKEAYINIEKFLNDNFVNVINIMAFVVPLFVLTVCIRRKYFFTRAQLLVTGVLFVSVLLHHYLFFNFTSLHDFSVLKTGMFLILLTALMVSRIGLFCEQVKWGRIVFISVMCVFLLVKSKNAYDKFDHVNRFEEIDYRFKIVGTLVKKHAAPDEKIFSNVIYPMVNYYAGRNVFYDSDGKSARAMGGRQKIKILFVHYQPDGHQRVVHYKPNGDSLALDFHMQKPEE